MCCTGPDVALEQLLSVELKEFSDGETTVALTSVTTDVEVWSLPYNAASLLAEHHANGEGSHSGELC